MCPGDRELAAVGGDRIAGCMPRAAVADLRRMVAPQITDSRLPEKLRKISPSG
jgi:hypothetical protein